MGAKGWDVDGAGPAAGEPEVLLPARTDDWERRNFERQWALAGAAVDEQRRQLWAQMAEEWVEAKAARSKSTSTRHNYRDALRRWQAFLAGAERPVELWEVDNSHVRAWQNSMRARGLSEVTINQQLSCVSSFYSYVIAEKRMVQGIEIDLFVDRAGRERANPFRTGNVARGRVQAYERARPLTLDEYNRLLDSLEAQRETLAGARNYALILTYLHTGWRSSELLRMKWGDIRPSRAKREQYIFAWKGKGAKAQDDSLPAECYRAIVAWLELAGRWPLEDEEYVWLPAVTPEMSGRRDESPRPITEKSALRALRAALGRAGIPDAHLFRVHDLRHTHASLLLQSGQSLATIQARLHHSSLATTGIYVAQAHREDPVDTFSARFRRLRKAE